MRYDCKINEKPKEEVIRFIMLNAGRDTKEIFGNRAEINFEEEQEQLLQTTDKMADTNFKLEIVLKQK